MQNINDLQTAASRFGTVAGFGALVPTGQADGTTVQAVQSALVWIRDHVSGESDTATGLISRITDASALQNAQTVDGLTTYLNQIADANNLGGSSFDFAPVAAGITSFKQAWAAVPTWAKIVGGIGLAAGLFFIGRSLTKRHAHAHALHGMDYDGMANMFGWN